MRIAKEIEEATFGEMCRFFTDHGQRYYVIDNSIVKRDKIESIIAAKLEPVKQELYKLYGFAIRSGGQGAIDIVEGLLDLLSEKGEE